MTSQVHWVKSKKATWSGSMAAMAALSTKIGTTYAEAGDQKLAGQSSLFAVARPQRMRPSTKPPGAEAAVDAISREHGLRS